MKKMIDRFNRRMRMHVFVRVLLYLIRINTYRCFCIHLYDVHVRRSRSHFIGNACYSIVIGKQGDVLL